MFLLLPFGLIAGLGAWYFTRKPAEEPVIGTPAPAGASAAAKAAWEKANTSKNIAAIRKTADAFEKSGVPANVAMAKVMRAKADALAKPLAKPKS